MRYSSLNRHGTFVPAEEKIKQKQLNTERCENQTTVIALTTLILHMIVHTSICKRDVAVLLAFRGSVIAAPDNATPARK